VFKNAALADPGTGRYLLHGCPAATTVRSDLWSIPLIMIGLSAGTIMGLEHMISKFLRGTAVGLSALSVFIISAGPVWAGNPVPAPLIGATGPFGLLAAGIAYGGYLLVKRLRSRG
jgi:hypothetical protein